MKPDCQNGSLFSQKKALIGHKKCIELCGLGTNGALPWESEDKEVRVGLEYGQTFLHSHGVPYGSPSVNGRQALHRSTYISQQR